MRGDVVVSCAPCWMGGIVSGSCEREMGYVARNELGSGDCVMCGVYATIQMLTTYDGKDGVCEHGWMGV